ncbi:YciI family protein [Agromyces sp. MMS24-JH15]|uniref:YciI family protein n=1 Tax=Agromyces sp. MMS24-JH15 TaxID=3243765 RepID=UPI003747EE29
MEYALFYREGTDPQPYAPEDDDIGAWVADLVARDVSEYGERLRPPQDATTVRIRRGELLVTDGPFTEAKEAIGGFDVIVAADLDEAIEVASRHPAARFGEVEVRPFVQWPDAGPGSRVVPDGFPDRPVHGSRYLMLVIADPSAAQDAASGGEGDDDPEAWVREMDARGARLFGDVLRPPSDATFVRRRDDRVIVTDGPFSEAKEWVAGFDLIEAADLADAVGVAAGHPMARGGILELWPLWPFDPDDDHVARAAREDAERDVRLQPGAAEVLAALAAERAGTPAEAGR